MTTDVFSRAVELTDARVPRRLLNYGGLIDPIADSLVANPAAGTNAANLRQFGRWLRVHESSTFISSSASPCGAATESRRCGGSAGHPRTWRADFSRGSTARGQSKVRAVGSTCAFRSASTPAWSGTASSAMPYGRCTGLRTIEGCVVRLRLDVAVTQVLDGRPGCWRTRSRPGGTAEPSNATIAASVRVRAAAVVAVSVPRRVRRVLQRVRTARRSRVADCAILRLIGLVAPDHARRCRRPRRVASGHCAARSARVGEGAADVLRHRLAP